MKTLNLFLFLFLTFSSCNKSDEVVTPKQVNAIVSTWKLVKYEPGFGPTNTYNNGQIQWTFNSNNTVNVVIVNGTNVNNSLPLNTNGSYTYIINGNQITINNVVYKYEIINNELKIEDLIGQSSDGKKLSFLVIN
jgi:hypothetical protein